jgi:hypothetical protein
MKHITPDALEALAASTGRQIEHDPTTGVMYVTVNRVTYTADLPEVCS